MIPALCPVMLHALSRLLWNASGVPDPLLAVSIFDTYHRVMPHVLAYAVRLCFKAVCIRGRLSSYDPRVHVPVCCTVTTLHMHKAVRLPVRLPQTYLAFMTNSCICSRSYVPLLAYTCTCLHLL